MHTISSYRSNRPTTQPQTDMQTGLIHYSAASTQCSDNNNKCPSEVQVL